MRDLTDPYLALLSEYAAAMAQEREEWKLVSDAAVAGAERVMAYARWRQAADRIRTLAIRMREAGAFAPPPPERADDPVGTSARPRPLAR